ncbi:precursor to secretory protein Ssp120 [Crucibulum laeve]|uniref:Precursor to secretory protein Ssp120 n=1 Tax=Crucibulum laeve TaxID=68775 RepID=A0A5C3M998_9AGAR|nr:precursor to secretory protein Ssp120 [Crucibulum laeve]
MLALTSLSFLVLAHGALAHGGHEHSGPATGETIQQYAQRHMSSEHHIDSFDTRSFFQLHDLDRNGFWDRPEIEAVYGVHHVYSQKKSKDDVEHQKKADHIVDAVLQRLDLNHDGKVTPEELEKVGLDGLPNFDDIGAEGHHYDVESEFFLHHEEQFHSTPETQTDESYNHPEDLEHFAQHEAIERKEAEREAKFQGITVEEALKSHEFVDVPPPQENEQKPLGIPVNPHDEQVEVPPPVQEPPKPKYTRVPPPEKQDPSVRFKGAKSEGERKGEWGTGSGGFNPPKEPSDKMRKNLPYKERMQYKFRRNWGDF